MFLYNPNFWKERIRFQGCLLLEEVSVTEEVIDFTGFFHIKLSARSSDFSSLDFNVFSSHR